MKNTLFLLTSAAALSLASCGDKKTETTTTTTEITPGTTAAVVDNDEMYKQRSMRVADKYIADMKVSDAAMQEKIRIAYYNRSKRFGETRAKYQADTTGMAAAMREADMATDTEFKTIYADPTQYQAYESSRSTYDEKNYMDGVSSDMSDSNMSSGDAMSSGTAADASTSNNATSSTDMGATSETGKAKMADGSKIKISTNGDVKIKDAEGNITKVDGDDGTVKIKPKNEEKTKVK